MDQLELLRQLVELLRTTEGVSGAAYFGSIASDTHDEPSDIDLIVRCEPEAKPALVRRLEAELEVVLYRPFTSARAPSGRYWFAGTHPFTRLDASFHDPSNYDDVVSNGTEFVRPPLRPIDLRHAAGSRAASPMSPTRWPSIAFQFAGALRDYQDVVKALIRGRRPKRSFAEAEEAVERFEGAALPSGAWELYLKSAEVARLGMVA